jgi:hypothetical protein
MPAYIQSVIGLAVTKAAAATLPAPTDTTVPIADGVDIRTWKPRSGAGYPAANVTLFADGAATLTNPELWGYEPTHGRWGFISSLNGGTAITLTTVRSFYQQINLPTMFDYLAVVGTVSANNVGYQLMPISSLGGG